MPSVDVGVVQQFLHPPLGLLRPHLDYRGSYSGNQTLTIWSDVPGPTFASLPVSNTFGALIQLDGAIPAGWGWTSGWTDPLGQYTEDAYEPRLAQVVVQHQLVGGIWVTTQVEEIVSFPRVVLWDVALPGRIGLLVAPGLAFDLFYLLVN